MSLNELLAVLEPPTNPIETGTLEDWRGIQQSLGLELPDDYKAFIKAYGTGSIGRFIIVWNPFSSTSGINLTHRALLTLEGLEGTDVPYTLFPEAGGIYPFAATIDGDLFFWKTVGNPKDWTMVLHFHEISDRNREYEEHPYSFTEFIVRLIKNEIPSTELYQRTFRREAGFKVLSD